MALSNVETGGESEVEGENERPSRCGSYQDLFASPLCGREDGQKRMGESEGRGSPGHGGAYLRVIPEGRTPSAWDPVDNVPPFRAIPPALYWVSKLSIDCTLRRDAPGKNVKVARIELGVLKGVLS